MKIGIPKEIFQGERRVAVIPSIASALTKNKHEVFIETDAGSSAYFRDAQYKEAGAAIVNDVSELYKSVDIIFKVQPLQVHPRLNIHEADMLRQGAAIICFLLPLSNLETVKKLKERKITSFAMEYIPRITRAQSMDALSSMATISGYKAVLIAADHIGKLFPLLMTAAGTVSPATVLILGAGVAGLQAIATAKRLGAKVEAFDPRPAVKEQVKSLGAQFREMELPQEDIEAAGGYAKEQSEEFLKREQEAIAKSLPKADVVITTAQVFGKRAPVLITEEMVKAMHQGSIIIDLAAEQGGNCELTEPQKLIEKYGVSIYGAVNLPAAIPVDASLMYSKNITNLFQHLYKTEKLDFGDEITKGSCITHEGEIMNEMIKDKI